MLVFAASRDTDESHDFTNKSSNIHNKNDNSPYTFSNGFVKHHQRNGINNTVANPPENIILNNSKSPSPQLEPSPIPPLHSKVQDTYSALIRDYAVITPQHRNHEGSTSASSLTAKQLASSSPSPSPSLQNDIMLYSSLPSALSALHSSTSNNNNNNNNNSSQTSASMEDMVTNAAATAKIGSSLSCSSSPPPSAGVSATAGGGGAAGYLNQHASNAPVKLEFELAASSAGVLDVSTTFGLVVVFVYVYIYKKFN